MRITLIQDTLISEMSLLSDKSDQIEQHLNVIQSS